MEKSTFLTTGAPVNEPVMHSGVPFAVGSQIGNASSEISGRQSVTFLRHEVEAKWHHGARQLFQGRNMIRRETTDLK
jgi:hypothetical protein